MQTDSLYTTLVINKLEEAAEGFKIFYFDRASTKNITYKAGQYLTFIHKEHGQEIRRSYSLLSTPGVDEQMAIGVKRIDNGIFSRRLVDYAIEGSHVVTIGAAGFFVLPENIVAYKQVFLFAAGSGITPVYSLLKEILYKYKQLKVVLIYSNRSEATTAFYKQLNQLQEKFNERFVLRYIFSAVKLAARSHLNAEIIHALLDEFVVTNGEEVLCYICGPHHYMSRCTYALRLKNVPWENIKKESFNADRVATKAEPPVKTMQPVTISFNDKVYHLNVQYPQSILHNALQQNIPLPYSCETGRCGSCAAKCISGNVWMSYNEVLTDDNLNDGWILTCTGFPLNEVELKFE